MNAKSPKLRNTLVGAAGTVALVAAAWRQLTVRKAVYVFLLCFAWAELENAAYAPNALRPVFGGPGVNSLLSMELNGFAVLLAIMAADRLVPPSAQRVVPYLVALCAGVMIGSSLTWLLSQYIIGIPTAFAAMNGHEAFDTYVFRHATGRFAVLGLATYIYARHRSAAHSLSALRALQSAHVDIERRLLQSRLAAMQARVDPALMLDTLSRAERLYETDPDTADRLLKELTVYLRAAIPTGGESGATLANEVRLAAAFLNITVPASKGRLIVSDAVAGLGDGVHIPPMIVLPLIQHALGHRMEVRSGKVFFRIDSAVGNDRVAITIQDSDAGFSPQHADDASIAGVRERLATLYGSSASLTLQQVENGTVAVFEVPHKAGNVPTQ